MKSKDSNKKQILLLLLENDIPVTATKLSEQLKVSYKTVRNYLDELQSSLKSSNIDLVKKPNVGIYLDITEEQKSELKAKLDMKIDDVYSSKYRQKYILKTLFKNRYTYTIQLFADDLYCSKNTILSDLVYVEKWLRNHSLHLVRKQNQGLWIEGDENIFRDAMMSLFYETNYNENNTKSIKADELDYRLDHINYHKIKSFFPTLDFFAIQRILQEAEEKLGYYFTDQAFVNLIVHIAIALERIKFEKKISIEEASFEDIKDNNEYEIAKWVVSELCRDFKINIPEKEIAYICLHMLGSKIQQDIYLDDYDAILDSQDKVYVDMAKEIICLVAEILEIPLCKDKILLTGLVIHLRPTVIRLKNNLKLRNPLLSKIKEEYLSIFGATWSSNSIFEKRFNVSINEDEVGYIALHIASSIERLNNKVKAVIVCSSGIGTSQLVANRIKKHLTELEITNIIPVKYLTDNIIEENHIVISTVPLLKNSPKFINVSTFVNEKDIARIRHYLSTCKINQIDLDMLADNNYHRHNSSIYSNTIMSEEYCFIDKGDKSYIDTIKKYSFIMEEKGVVKKGFFKNILEREERSSTIIGNGITIPHAQEDFVNEPKICIVKLENPIEWQDTQVDLILILALKFKDIATTREFFKNFYALLDNKDLIDKIKNSSDTKEIVTIFQESK